MLSSIIIGSLESDINNTWEISHDTFDNSYITNQSIHQCIRLGKNVTPFLKKLKSSANMAVYGITETDDADGTNDFSVESYDITRKTFISCSNLNMKLHLLNFFSKDKAVMEAHEDDNICFVTVMNSNYKLISYSTTERIIQTYRHGGIYQGAAIIHKADANDIINLIVKDLKMNRYVKIVVKYDNESKSLSATKITDLNQEALNAIKADVKRVGNRMVHFKVTTKDISKITACYITDDKHDEMVHKLTEDISNAIILVVPDANNTLNDEDEQEELEEYFTENIKDRRVRAVTTVGVKLPKDFCRKYSILYLFDYNVAKGTLQCLKSN